jgi:hypothetical protein
MVVPSSRCSFAKAVGLTASSPDWVLKAATTRRLAVLKTDDRSLFALRESKREFMMKQICRI